MEKWLSQMEGFLEEREEAGNIKESEGWKPSRTDMHSRMALTPLLHQPSKIAMPLTSFVSFACSAA
jgi:hypothetical protein